MKRPSPPAPCCASSTTQRPGFSRRSSATPTASTSQPNSSSDPRPSQSSTKPTSTSPDSPTEPAWPTLRAHLLALAAETGEHPLRHLLTAAAGRDLRTAGDMAAVLDWRLPALTPTNPGPLPWLPGIPPTLHAHPVWGDYLAKRSQLVADLADQVQDHACQGDAEPVWAPPGSHPSTALIRRNRSVAGRQRHQSPRPATNRRSPTRNAPGPLETTPRPGYRACHRPASRCKGRRATGSDAPHLVAATTTGSAHTKNPNAVRAGRPRPADSTGHSRQIAALGTRGCTRRGDGRQAAHCRIWLFLQIKSLAALGRRRVSSLRCGPRRPLALVWVRDWSALRADRDSGRRGSRCATTGRSVG